MAQGHRQERWAHTSMLCALIANCHRDPRKSRPFKPDDFNPYARDEHAPEAVEVNDETIGLLRQAFSGKAISDSPSI